MIKAIVYLTAFIAGALTLYVWQHAHYLDDYVERNVTIAGLTDLQCFHSANAPRIRLVLAAGVVDLLLIIFVVAFGIGV